MKRLTPLPWIFVGALTMIAAVFAWLYLAAPSAPPREIRLSVEPPEGVRFARRAGGHLAISPDGSMIAFSGFDSTRSTHLYLRAMNDATPRKLPGTEGALRPFWSPDNRWIGFEASQKLKKIDIMGGSPLTICDLNAAQGSSWNASGQIVYNGYGVSSGLWVVSANGGESRPLMNADTTTLANSLGSRRWPWFLPDGEHFLFTQLLVGGGQDGTVMIGSLSSSEPKELLQARSNAQYADGHIFFYRDNKLIAQPFDASSLELTGDPIPLTENPTYDAGGGKANFSVSAEGTVVQTSSVLDNDAGDRSTAWLDRSGNITTGPILRGNLRELRLSPDGSRLALAEGEGQLSDIWVYDMPRNVRSRLTFGAGSEFNPTWSPDGRFIHYTSFQLGGEIGLSRKDAVGLGTEEQLVKPDGRERTSDISPDGRYLFFLRSRLGSGRDDIFALPLQGDKKPVVVVKDDFDKQFPSISPDGRWLAYSSNETGTFQVYVVPFPPTGSRWQISSGRGNVRGQRWRSDGKELFYVTQGDLYSVAIQTKGDVFIPATPILLFNSGTTVGEANPFNWDVMPDGKKFVFIRSSVSTNQLDGLALVVMNWKRAK